MLKEKHGPWPLNGRLPCYETKRQSQTGEDLEGKVQHFSVNYFDGEPTIIPIR